MRNKRIIVALTVSVSCLALAGGIYTGYSTGASNPPVEGETLVADPSTMVDTAKSITLIDNAKVALCKTTITGVQYFANYTQYVGGQWYLGLSALTLAQSLSPTKDRYDTAGNALMQTTITGKRYCMNPTKWPSGQWALAFNTLATERADLVANPQSTGPTVK